MQGLLRVEETADVLGDVLVATTVLLRGLATTRTAVERAALGAEFDATVLQVRDDIMHRTGCPESAANACLAQALTQAAEEVARELA